MRSIAQGAIVGLCAVCATVVDAPTARAVTANPQDPEQVALGEQVYRAHCASCHGTDLEGQPDWQRRLPEGGFPAPPHDADGHTWHHADRLLFEITKFGGQALAPSGFASNMPAFGEQLSDEEIWAVLAFIKSHWPEEIRERQAEISRANP